MKICAIHKYHSAEIRKRVWGFFFFVFIKDANPKELEDGVCVCVWCRYSGVCGGDGRIPSQILGGEEHVPCHLLPWYLQRAAPTCVSSCVYRSSSLVVVLLFFFLSEESH